MSALPKRFWSKVNKGADGGCWSWTGSATYSQYGRYWDGTRDVQAHRASYEDVEGLIPVGMQIDHLCHNTLCVNPSHLRMVTPGQNQQNRKGASSASSSGVRGVYWKSQRQHWAAFVKVNGHEHYGGGYSTIAEAEKAVIELRRRLMPFSTKDQACKNVMAGAAA